MYFHSLFIHFVKLDLFIATAYVAMFRKWFARWETFNFPEWFSPIFTFFSPNVSPVCFEHKPFYHTGHIYISLTSHVPQQQDVSPLGPAAGGMGGDSGAFRSDKNIWKVEQLAASQESAYLTVTHSSWDVKQDTKTNTHSAPRWPLPTWHLIRRNGFNMCREPRGASPFIADCRRRSEWVKWMAGYRRAPSHPAGPQPAAPDSAPICLPCLSGRIPLALFWGESFVFVSTAVNTWGDGGRCTQLHRNERAAIFTSLNEKPTDKKKHFW